MIQFYPHAFRSAVEFIEFTEEAGAAPGWRDIVPLIPVLEPEQLPRLAMLQTNSDNYELLLRVGKQWLESMFDARLRVFAVGLLACGIGEHYNLKTKTTHDLDGQEITQLDIKATFLLDRVLLGLWIG